MSWAEEEDCHEMGGMKERARKVAMDWKILRRSMSCCLVQN